MDKPLKLGISSCLTGKKVRYNGEDKADPFLIEILGKYVEYVPICPETECGMGVPRETLHLTGDPDNPRLVTTHTGKDYTEQMAQWAAKRTAELKKENLCGFIFKKNSPSCGMECVKVYNEKGEFVKKGIGIFARVFMSYFPILPTEDELRLCDPVIRKNFIERIFVFKRQQELLFQDKTIIISKILQSL